MAWEVEFTDEFEDWWNKLEETEQIKIDAAIRMLEEYGPDLPYPMSSGVNGSRHSHMRELRVQVQGRPFRVLYAFNPKRTAILLVGGDKSGDGRWYEIQVPRADKLYDQHLEELNKESKKEGPQHGEKV
ncbi:MAG: type II toxin-antitoxin system RelE/ParE family toxin [Bryobacteraceae bacterium]